MKIFSENDFSLLRKYFSGQLSPAEEDMLAPRLNLPGAQEELTFYQALFHTLEMEEDRRLKEMLVAEEKRSFASASVEEPSRLRRRAVLRWAAAAAGFLLLAVSLFLIRQDRPIGHFDPYPAIGQTATRSGDTTSVEQEAFYWYGKKHYRKALRYFRRLPSSPAIDFYQANALLALGKAEEAVPLLSRVATAGESVYGGAAKFYLGLAFYHLRDYQQAGSWLRETLASPQVNDRQKKIAEDLMEEMGPME